MGRYLLRFLALAFVIAPCRLSGQQNDTLICNHLFSYAFEHKLIEEPPGEILAAIGRQFIGNPYEAHTLDRSINEELVTDLHSFDCVTFIENALALARAVMSNRLTFDAYREQLRLLRYRGGVIDGYTSRLHYFTEWIADNAAKGILRDVTQEIGGVPFKKDISFMSSHREVYPQLAADSLFGRMQSIERALSQKEMFYIPKALIRSIDRKIHTGDVIAITTLIEGLDVTHTGIAVRIGDGTLHYMHAPNVNGIVTISAEPLWKYVGKFSANSGLIVARPVDAVR